MRYIEFAILGFGTGAVIAGIALGLVVAYRASGVINFAHGAIAAFTAYTYNSLRLDGTIPIPPIPNPVAPIEAIFDVEPHVAVQRGVVGFDCRSEHWKREFEAVAHVFRPGSRVAKNDRRTLPADDFGQVTDDP